MILKARTETNNVIFEVQDTGCGIDVKDQKYLFEPYNKKKPQKNNLGGLGLGLTLSKMLVELHGGKIWVNSTKGKGSTFGFSIPAYGQRIPVKGEGVK